MIIMKLKLQKITLKQLLKKKWNHFKNRKEKWKTSGQEIKRKIQNEKNQENQKQLKLALLTPHPQVPQRELCAYEKIRENNIRERMDAMAESGFFEDLADTKKEIGLGQLKKKQAGAELCQAQVKLG